MASFKRKMNLEVQIPDDNNHMLLPLIDFNWHFQSVVSPSSSRSSISQSPVYSPLASPAAPSSRSSSASPHGKSPLIEEEEESRDEFFRVFKAFDENDDGLISKEEVGKLMEKLGHPMSDSDLELLWLSVDLNGDGCVDFDEFHSLYNKLDQLDRSGSSSDDEEIQSEEEEEEENLMDAFRMFDKNDDGFITAEELHIVLSKLGFVQGASSIAACRKMIQGVDSNGDGLVDFREFKDMMMCRPSPRAYFATMIEAA